MPAYGPDPKVRPMGGSFGREDIAIRQFAGAVPASEKRQSFSVVPIQREEERGTDPPAAKHTIGIVGQVPKLAVAGLIGPWCRGKP